MRKNSSLKAFTNIFHKALSFLKKILSSPVGRRRLLYGFLKRLLILYLLFWVYAFIAYPEFVPRSFAHLPELFLILPCLFSLILALPLFPPTFSTFLPFCWHTISSLSAFSFTGLAVSSGNTGGTRTVSCLLLRAWRESRKKKKPYSKFWTAFLRRTNHVREFLCRPRKKRKGSCEASGKGCFTFILRFRFMPCFSLRLRFRDPLEGCSFFLYSPFFILFLYLSIGLFIQRIFFSIAFRLCSVVCFISFSFVLFLTGSGILSRMESFGPISPDSYCFSTMETILSYMAKERFCSYRGRHVELCKHSNFAYMEKEGANA